MELNPSKQATTEYLREAAAQPYPFIGTRGAEVYEALGRARSGIEQRAHSMQAKMSKRPFTSVMAALALGMIVGALAGRRR
jgi:hypothetical protein